MRMRRFYKVDCFATLQFEMYNDQKTFFAAGIFLLLLFYNNAEDLYNSIDNVSNTDKEQIQLEDSQQHSLKANCTRYISETEYHLLENGSLLLPNSDNIYGYETYFLRNDTAFICIEGTDQSLDAAEQEPIYNFSNAFLSCGHILIDPDEYELLQNGSIYVDIYNRVYGSRDYYIQERGVYVCLPEYEKMKLNMSRQASLMGHLNKFSESFVYVTYVGLTLSIISLLSHLVVFCMVSSVRNLPGCCLASLSLSLLVAYLCFLALALVETTDHCATLGMSVYYFFLTSFFWMNAIAFDVWRSFRVVMRELRISSHRVPWRRFLLYSIYSWLVPAILVVLVIIADSTDLLPEEFRPSFGDPICWFGRRKALLVFFAVPLIIVMMLNGIFFLDVTYVISRATLKTSHSHEATLKRRFFMFMRLALIMGLTWIVGLLAGYVDHSFMWYLFVVLNTLQGLFIFVVFSCSSKVRGLWCKKYRKRSKASTNTSVRTISAAV